MRKILTVISCLFFSLSLLAQDAVSESTTDSWLNWNAMNTTEQLVIILGITVFFVVIYAMHTITKLVKILAFEVHKENMAKHGIDVVAWQKAIAKEKAEAPSIWKRWMDKLADAKPIEQESDIMLHHSYDGIRELDNNLPPWWVYMFYGTIAFAIVFFSYKHIFNMGLSTAEQYEVEMQTAAIAKQKYLAKMANLVDENSVTQIIEKGGLAKGKTIFLEKCAACHGQNGEGGVGPNFADSYWIHGGDIKDVFTIVKYGVPAKGMVAWQAQLRPIEMQQVASYILSLEGTNPPNQKEKQGELYEREKEVEKEKGKETE